MKKLREIKLEEDKQMISGVFLYKAIRIFKVR